MECQVTLKSDETETISESINNTHIDLDVQDMFIEDVIFKENEDARKLVDMVDTCHLLISKKMDKIIDQDISTVKLTDKRINDSIDTINEEDRLSHNDVQRLIEVKVLNSPNQETPENTDALETDEANDTVSPVIESTNIFPYAYYNWTVMPKLICSATKEYQPTMAHENFTKGCQWSPDGTCLLVPSDDFRIRIYELPRSLYSGRLPMDFIHTDFPAALTVKEGGLIYDSCWYPYMNSWDSATCCFISTSKESPAHLWDAFTGKLRATYRAYNQVDEVEASISVQFIDSGQEVWCGYKNALRIFKTERPGRQTSTISLKTDFPNTYGLVSCIKENPIMPGLVAFGTYSKCIGLYKDIPVCTFKTGSGVTQIEFSPCGTKLYSAVRRSNELLCWDLRNPGIVLHSFQNRQSDTNQRIQFCVSADGSEIVSGGTDGIMRIWELSKCSDYTEDVQPKYKIELSRDSLNGVSLHKTLPIIATSTGQRVTDTTDYNRDNSVRLWWVP